MLPVVSLDLLQPSSQVGNITTVNSECYLSQQTLCARPQEGSGGSFPPVLWLLSIPQLLCSTRRSCAYPSFMGSDRDGKIKQIPHAPALGFSILPVHVIATGMGCCIYTGRTFILPKHLSPARQRHALFLYEKHQKK